MYHCWYHQSNVINSTCSSLYFRRDKTARKLKDAIEVEDNEDDDKNENVFDRVLAVKSSFWAHDQRRFRQYHQSSLTSSYSMASFNFLAASSPLKFDIEQVKLIRFDWWCLQRYIPTLLFRAPSSGYRHCHPSCENISEQKARGMAKISQVCTG